MPIKAEDKARYPADWKAISLRVRAEAGQRCEQCRAPNGEYIVRGQAWDADTYMLRDGGEVFHSDTGEFLGARRGSEYCANRIVRVVLTVAHLDHNPENCERDNLRALCQRCHLRYDKSHHAANAAATRHSRKAVADLFMPQEKGE